MASAARAAAGWVTAARARAAARARREGGGKAEGGGEGAPMLPDRRHVFKAEYTP